MNRSDRYRRAAEVRYRILDGEAVVIRQRAAEVLGIDPVGSRLLELLDGERTLGEVLDRLETEYAAPAGEIETDVAAFLDELMAAGVVEPTDAAR